MSNKDLLNDISSIKKEISIINKKLDMLIKRQEEIEKNLESFNELEDMIETLPAKLNTSSFQIISNFEESTKKISKNLEESINENLEKMDSLVDVNERLDKFEDYLKAYISKMRAMLLEIEDSIRR